MHDQAESGAILWQRHQGLDRGAVVECPVSLFKDDIAVGDGGGQEFDVGYCAGIVNYLGWGRVSCGYVGKARGFHSGPSEGLMTRLDLHLEVPGTTGVKGGKGLKQVGRNAR